MVIGRLSRLINRAFNKKEKIAFAVVAVVMIGAVSGTTFALLNKKSDAAVNEFDGAAVNVAVLENGRLYEDGISGNENASYEKIVTNQETAKDVKIENVLRSDYPTTDTYVRVRLVPSFVYDNGAYAGQVVPVNMAGTVSYSYGDDSRWQRSEVNGETYYYYTSAIEPGGYTGSLITGVTYTGEVPANAHFELHVLTEGVAAKQAGSLTMWGFASGKFENLQSLK